jgi:membrane associated rhomboid family serine protease
MANRWFSGQQKRPGHVNWGRQVRVDTERANQVLWGLIGVNVVVFLLWQIAWGTILENLLVDHFLVSAESVFSLRLWTLVTSEFSHTDGVHLLFNMLALWIFGRDVAHSVGWKHFLHLYLAGAIVASLGHVAFQLMTGDPTPALGASGAVMAISVVFAALFPNRTLMINFFIPVPAALAVGFYILMDVMGLMGTGSGVAHAAHLGGALYGLLFWWWRFKR